MLLGQASIPEDTVARARRYVGRVGLQLGFEAVGVDRAAEALGASRSSVKPSTPSAKKLFTITRELADESIATP
ncbi:MAG: hypothetical protein ABIF28_15870 [Pseudomonadota bacterium]